MLIASRLLVMAALALPAVCAVASTADLPSAAARPGRAAALTCVPRGAHVVLATARAVVFRRRGGRYEDPASKPGNEAVPVYYGCLHRRNRAVRLGIDGDCYDNIAVAKDSLRLAGRFVALAFSNCAIDSGVEGVIVHDLSARRQVTTVFRESAEVASIGLTSTGTVAWIFAFTVRPDRVTPTPEVHRAAPRGPDTVLDRTPGIEPGSLAVAGTPPRAYWMVAGTPRSALLG